ncbi:hypothetical protein GUITHDRAFT_48049, partial [Guillardia theta CCMP2712]
VAEQAIAAVVYHQDWLRRNMPGNHPLFDTELFSYHEFLPLLSRYISMDVNGRKPTGLPPHVMTIRSMEEMKGAVDGMNLNIAEMRGSINHLTKTNATIEEKLATCFRTSADSIFRSIEENPPLADFDGGEVDDGNRQTVNDNTVQGDESSLIPTSFEWVKANTRAIFTQWHFGNREKGYPAYKTLKPRHFYTKDQKKRFSDLRYLVREI